MSTTLFDDEHPARAPSSPPAHEPSHTSGLTPDQRRAVEHQAGPAIVLAGPGTGKTRVITRRIADLVSQRDVDPASILALTFSTKAAGELRDRLSDLIGHHADAVRAHTFHGFGLRVTQRFGDTLGIRSAQTMMDSALHRRVLRDLTLTHSLFADHASQGLDGAIEHAMGLIAQLADHALDPAQAADAISRWAHHVESHADQHDEQWLAAERQRIAIARDAATLYAHFANECRRRGWLTFSDLVALPIRIFDAVSFARDVYQSEIRHVVVDEFQDCSRGQLELLRRICPPALVCSSADRSVVVVGDDDQSIYGFRGADDRAFARFQDEWNVPAEHTITLSENFRSAPAIIDVTNRLISRAGKRFMPDKVVVPGSPDDAGTDTEGSVELVATEDTKQDGEIIAAMIQADRVRTGRDWSKYAVIARSNPHLVEISEALRLEGVPVRAHLNLPLRDDEAVRDALAWAWLIVDPTRTWDARRILSRPPYTIDAQQLSAWERSYTAWASRARAADDVPSDQQHTDEGIVAWLKAQPIDESHAAPMQRFINLYDALTHYAATHAGDETLFRIIADTGLAHNELLDAHEHQQRVDRLIALIALARRVQPLLEEPGDLAALLQHLEDLNDKEWGDGGGRGANGEANDDRDRIDGSDNTSPHDEPVGVELLTAHKSKGLEYEVVFVPRVQPTHAGQYCAVRTDDAIRVPESILDPTHADARPELDILRDEARRLVYVACTRTERRLVLLAKQTKARSKTFHIFQEMQHEDVPDQLASYHTAAEVIDSCASAGVRIVAHRDEALGISRTWKQQQDAAQLITTLRTQIRLAATRALNTADLRSVDRASLDNAQSELARAASRLAALAHVQQGQPVPDWLLTDDAVFVEQLKSLAQPDPAHAAPISASSAPVFKPMQPPLSLSYSKIDLYGRCPRCFYVEHVLGLPQRPSPEPIIGRCVHEALQEYTSRARRAETGDAPAPTRADLAALGKFAYWRNWPTHWSHDPAALKRIQAQLAQYHDTFDALAPSSGAQVLEIERSISFSYPHASTHHSFNAKLDRIDQLDTPAGLAFRIVDYKTGNASAKLTAPKKDDMQLGIYAMALARFLNLDPLDGPADLVGTAEYWILATGDRGTINLADINLSKVRTKIDAAIEGVLAGNFSTKGKACRGECDVLGPP